MLRVGFGVVLGLNFFLIVIFFFFFIVIIEIFHYI